VLPQQAVDVCIQPFFYLVYLDLQAQLQVLLDAFQPELPFPLGHLEGGVPAELVVLVVALHIGLDALDLVVDLGVQGLLAGLHLALLRTEVLQLGAVVQVLVIQLLFPAVVQLLQGQLVLLLGRADLGLVYLEFDSVLLLDLLDL